MIEVFKFVTGSLSVNTYVLAKKGESEAVAIDVGGDAELIEKEMLKHGFTIKTVLLTHGHFDHIGGVKYFQNKGAKVYIGEKDEKFLHDKSLNLALICGANIESFYADYTLKEGDEITLHGINFKVYETPGHTIGSVCYLTENYIFTGDTLFERSFGRFDFPTGDFNALTKSIIRLFEIDEDLIVYPGHGGATRLLEEKDNNSILNYI